MIWKSTWAWWLGFAATWQATAVDVRGQLEGDRLRAANVLSKLWEADAATRGELNPQAAALAERSRSLEIAKAYVLALISQGQYGPAWEQVTAQLLIWPEDQDLLRWASWLGVANRQYDEALRYARKAAGKLPATIAGRGDAVLLGGLMGFLESLSSGGIQPAELARQDQAIRGALAPPLAEPYAAARAAKLASLDRQQAGLQRQQQQAAAAAEQEREKQLAQLDQQRQALQERADEVSAFEAQAQQQAAGRVSQLQAQDSLLAGQAEQVYWQTQDVLDDLNWALFYDWDEPLASPSAFSPWYRPWYRPSLNRLGAELYDLQRQADRLSWSRSSLAVQQMQTLAELQAQQYRAASEWKRLDQVRRRLASRTLRARKISPRAAPLLSRRAMLASVSQQVALDLAGERQRLMQQLGAAAPRRNPVEF